MHKAKFNLMVGLWLVATAVSGQESGGGGSSGGGTAWIKTNFNRSANAAQALTALGVLNSTNIGTYNTDQFTVTDTNVAIKAGPLLTNAVLKGTPVLASGLLLTNPVLKGTPVLASGVLTTNLGARNPKFSGSMAEAYLGDKYRFLMMGHSRLNTNASNTDTNYTVYEYLRLNYLPNATWSTNWSVNSATANFVDTNYTPFVAPHKTASGTNLVDIIMIGVNGVGSWEGATNEWLRISNRVAASEGDGNFVHLVTDPPFTDSLWSDLQENCWEWLIDMCMTGHPQPPHWVTMAHKLSPLDMPDGAHFETNGNLRLAGMIAQTMTHPPYTWMLETEMRPPWKVRQLIQTNSAPITAYADEVAGESIGKMYWDTNGLIFFTGLGYKYAPFYPMGEAPPTGSGTFDSTASNNVVTAAVAAANPKELHVDWTGNDTTGRPYQTFEGALSNATAGDTIILAAGTWSNTAPHW